MLNLLVLGRNLLCLYLLRMSSICWRCIRYQTLLLT